VDDFDRRRFLIGTGAALGTAAAAASLTACGSTGVPGEPAPGEPAPASPVHPLIRPPADPTLVRVTSVPTAVDGNVLPVLIAEFEKRTPYRVALVATPNLYDDARAGKVDVAISHYGHRHAEAFVTDGLGEWPRTIFSNQLALVGPRADPAALHDVEDAGVAFRQLHARGAPYLVNELEGLRYVTEILWHLADKPDRTRWLRAHEKADALVEANKAGAYVLWGLTPFLRTRKQLDLPMTAYCLGDPLFQRLLVSIVVKPTAGAVNVDGARAFQTFLLEPETQARMRSISYSDEEKLATWVPAGRSNRIAILPGTSG
jgi:tungstate transport system substrate-binding protein